MTQRYTHRGLRYGLALLIATSGAGFATAAFSQAVPVPKPAPKARDGGMQMSAQDKPPMTTGATQAPPNPVIPNPNRNVPANVFATFDAAQYFADRIRKRDPMVACLRITQPHGATFEINVAPLEP